jgi:hypothetical protein
VSQQQDEVNQPDAREGRDVTVGEELGWHWLISLQDDFSSKILT